MQRMIGFTQCTACIVLTCFQKGEIAGVLRRLQNLAVKTFLMNPKAIFLFINKHQTLLFAEANVVVF